MLYFVSLRGKNGLELGENGGRKVEERRRKSFGFREFVEQEVRGGRNEQVVVEEVENEVKDIDFGPLVGEVGENLGGYFSGKLLGNESISEKEGNE